MNMSQIEINPGLFIGAKEIHEEFVRSSGAGGQNVNKVATAVQLRFDVAHSSLPDDVRERLKNLAGKRLTGEGVLVIKAQSHRTQERNRQEALQRLVELIRAATIQPKLRIATKPTRASQRRRVESKRQRGEIKRLRQGHFE
jgi:ribosome-associated protein